MEDVIQWIASQLESAGVPYEFEEWTDVIKYPYFVGDYDESPGAYEDGVSDSFFRITGFTRHTWAELYAVDKKLKQMFPLTTGKTAILGDGSGIAVFYDSSAPEPTGEEGLKKLEIRLQIKFWKVG